MIIQSHIVIISVCIIKYNSEISITPHQLLASIKTSLSSTSTLYLKHKNIYQRIVIIVNYLTQLNEKNDNSDHNSINFSQMSSFNTNIQTTTSVISNISKYNIT